ncbi:uncharacterized protein LOC135832370 isoform X2 [Planococcus citri]|uniref:uncharacterized protein LOC135832370 isoform X2 n=1 Tax=Planococcus citri TaxID=170843 RepID=UPI0031F76DFC
MLPELEKGIPKPLKKRYRDLFEDDGNPPNIVVPNESANTIETLAYADASHHIPDRKENINYQQLHMPTNLYRKSVINRSIKEHISIIDIEQMTPKLADSADAPTKREDEAKFHLETDENQTSHFVYLSNNYLINSPEVQFVGKLKVKWREKYENLGDIADINGINLNDCNVNILDNFNGYGYVKSNENSKPASNHSNKCIKAPTRQTTRLQMSTAVADAEDRISDSEKITDDQSKDVPVVRKMERARKGLIYQKFMADTYSWNKKEKSSSSKSTTEVTQTQPRKRGRPRTRIPEDVKRPKDPEFNASESTVTIMRLERKKNSNTLKYTVVERKNSKKSSFVEKKTS